MIDETVNQNSQRTSVPPSLGYLPILTDKRLRLVLLIGVLTALLPLPCYSFDDDVLSDFEQAFLRFSDNFINKDWDRVKEFISDDTSCGFGPDSGLECLDNYKDDQSCWYAAVIHLTLGCQFFGEDPDGNLVCGLPERSGDEILFRSNMELAFRYDRETRKMHATWLMCGGD